MKKQNLWNRMKEKVQRFIDYNRIDGSDACRAADVMEMVGKTYAENGMYREAFLICVLLEASVKNLKEELRESMIVEESRKKSFLYWLKILWGNEDEYRKLKDRAALESMTRYVERIRDQILVQIPLESHHKLAVWVLTTDAYRRLGLQDNDMTSVLETSVLDALEEIFNKVGIK